MSAKTVGFAIADEDRGKLDELVDYFGHGNRSAFLRTAIRTMRREMIAEKLRATQTAVRTGMGGRVVTPEETRAAVRAVVADHA